MEWLRSNYEPLSLLINTLIMLVWVFYAHLLLSNYRRRRRPKLLINQSVGKSPDSHCQICNMSEEAVYLTLVIARLEAEDNSWECDVTDYVKHDDPQRSLLEKTLQGPLQAGEVKGVGTFRSLINRVLRNHGLGEFGQLQQQDAGFSGLSIHAVFEYSSEKRPVGACRYFQLQEEGSYCRIKPSCKDTEDLAAPWHRRQVSRWLSQYL